MNQPSGEWIGVDFDRTLSKYIDWKTNGSSLGTPVPLMLERVKRWLAKGMTVKIFTARVASSSDNIEENRAAIQAWCLQHVGQVLEVTAEKDYNMVELWDDRAVRVKANEGYADTTSDYDPLTTTEELKMWRRREKDEDEDD